jgi:pimeloyl-ACP methyl ester carboxylesterase
LSDVAFHHRLVRSRDDGTALFYRRAGAGLPVLLCDGLLCEGHVWKYLFSELARDHELVHWNYPGHGRSADPLPWSNLSVERLADDAATVMEDAGVGPCVVVGHSLGVQVALETWNRHRERVRGLILVCGSPGRIIEEFHESAILEIAIPLLDVLTRFLPRQVGKAWKGLPTAWLTKVIMRTREVNNRLVRAADIGEYLGRMTRVELRIGLRILESAGKHDASDYLTLIDVPTLVIAGERDRFTPPHRSTFMASRIPDAELLMARGGTHSLPIEMPELVNIRIRRFLEAV